jgi:hypothetical protein
MMEPIFGMGIVSMPKWEDFQNLPDHTKGPVTFAEELGSQQRQAITRQIESNMQAAQQRGKSGYGKLLTQGVNVWA